MADTQLYLAVGVPVVVNLIGLGIFANLLIHHFDKRFDELDRRFEDKLGIR